MQNVQAEQGLPVSWGGFKNTVDKETATQFFRVRLRLLRGRQENCFIDVKVDSSIPGRGFQSPFDGAQTLWI